MTSMTMTSASLSNLDEDRRKLWKETFCKGATDLELDLFIAVCARTGLNPENRQIWAIKQWDKSLGREVLRAQTSVDGFRVVAERSGKYAGQIGPFWCDQDGVWVDVWLKSHPPAAAKVGILKTDWKEPLWSIARWDSFAARDKAGNITNFWAKMPDLMLAKVAESHGLRRAFPNDLSGIYTKEEMDQAFEHEPENLEDHQKFKQAAQKVIEAAKEPKKEEPTRQAAIFQLTNKDMVDMAKKVLGKTLGGPDIDRALVLLNNRPWSKDSVISVLDAIKLEKEVYEAFQ